MGWLCIFWHGDSDEIDSALAFQLNRTARSYFNRVVSEKLHPGLSRFRLKLNAFDVFSDFHLPFKKFYGSKAKVAELLNIYSDVWNVVVFP